MQPPFTKIKFIKTLFEEPSGDHPALLYAREGETGIIGSNTSSEGYWAQVDGFTNWFGIREDEFVRLENAQ